MAKNEFLTFGTAEGANVLSNEEYAALAARVNGFSAGVAKSRELNKAWRQSSIITHILAQYIADESGNDVLDNGDINALKKSLALAIKNALPEVRDATLTEKGITQLTDKTGNSNTLAATQKLVTDVNNNANTKLAKSQNGADIPNKSEFVKNLGLAETAALAKNAFPKAGGIVNGNVDATGYVKSGEGKDVVSSQDIWATRYIFENGQRVYSPNNKPSAEDVGAFPGVIGFENIPARSYVGAFSSGAGTGWAKGLNFGYTNKDVGQIYVNSIGDLYAYFLNSNTKSYGGIVNTHPVGSPIPWPQLNPPSGYLTCNGQAFDKSLYPNLAVAYPNGRVPDLRGEFIRGWDDSRGVDPGRVCGTWQGDAIRNITGDASFGGNYGFDAVTEATGVFSGKNAMLWRANTRRFDAETANTNLVFDASRVVPTANENRPRNIAFNYIVRAA
ncbi:phage tail protein [Photorhabdus australis]|uniref:phage tail protein n=1 Tax=Photorhabdus australis TaxID=286156 RepID=UPI000907B620|nr:phage tail protein [Photorhabdus australis]